MENIELILSITATVLSILSFVFSILTYFISSRQQRQQATIDAFNKLQNEALDKLNAYTKKEVAEIAQNPRSEDYKELTALLARYQHFAVGVNAKIYDEKTLRRLADYYVVSLYDKLTPLIEKKRTISHSETLYEDLEGLANRLRHGN